MASRRLKKKHLKAKQLSLSKVQSYAQEEESVRENKVQLQETSAKTITPYKPTKKIRKRAIAKAKSKQAKTNHISSIQQPSSTKLLPQAKKSSADKQTTKANKKYNTYINKKQKKLQKKIQRKAKLEKQKAETKARNKELAKAKRSIGKDVQVIMSEQEQFKRNAQQTEPTHDNTAMLNSVELLGSRLDEYMNRAMSEDRIQLREFKRDNFFRIQDELYDVAYNLAEESAEEYDKYISQVTLELNTNFESLLYASTQFQIELQYAKIVSVIYRTPSIPLDEAKKYEDFISEYQWQQ